MKVYQTVTALVALLLIGLPVPARAAGLDELVQEALTANPEVKASTARWEMFAQKARAAGSLDDPMLMLGIDNGLVRDPLNLDRDMQTAKVIADSAPRSRRWCAPSPAPCRPSPSALSAAPTSISR